jgi:hypothetical protein
MAGVDHHIQPLVEMGSLKFFALLTSNHDLPDLLPKKLGLQA